jgi:tetratricopeptide (TPR) repeat protein
MESNPRVRAAELVRAGRMDEAIALLREATRRSPDDAGAWAELAGALAAANRADLALPAWERVIALAPLVAAGHAGRGRALQALARPAEAAAAFERALSLAADAHDARYGLAMIAFNAGQPAAAEAHARRLPPDPTKDWLLARIAGARGDFEGVRTMIEPLLPGLADASRADALLLLAEALDRLGRTSDAFAAAMQGKAIQHRLFAPRAAGREGETARLRRLIGWFKDLDPWLPTDAPPTDECVGHVFLVGFPRSGTTLLEQALAAHPQVTALEEAPTLAEARREFMATPEGLERLARLAGSEADRWRADYWRVVREHGADPAGRVFLDKAPAGTSDLPLIARLFPRAKILFAVRDPRDVVLSCAMNAFQMNALTYAFTSLADTAACYDAAMVLARDYRRILPLDVREVRYERLAEDFAGEVRAIAGFLGLAFDPAMTDPAAAARSRSVRTPSATHVRSGVDRRGLDRWRAYAAELAPVGEALAPWVEAWGYPAD